MPRERKASRNSESQTRETWSSTRTRLGINWETSCSERTECVRVDGCAGWRQHPPGSPSGAVAAERCCCNVGRPSKRAAVAAIDCPSVPCWRGLLYGRGGATLLPPSARQRCRDGCIPHGSQRGPLSLGFHPSHCGTLPRQAASVVLQVRQGSVLRLGAPERASAGFARTRLSPAIQQELGRPRYDGRPQQPRLGHVHLFLHCFDDVTAFTGEDSR